MEVTDDFFATNRSLWNGWTAIHTRSAFYDVDAFRRGRSTLNAIELEALGAVAGRSLLHLQCHFGMDTLSWARLGARVTGVDLSDAAVAQARALAGETGIPAEFVAANVYDVPRVLGREFDIVFTSYGVLAWLPDLPRWGEVVARSLRPGWRFFIVEFHPFASALADDGETVAYPYFHTPEPLRLEARGSYADPDAPFTHPAFEWTHSLADVVNALLGAGLTIEHVHEFPYSPYNCFPFVEEREPGRWVVRGGRRLPLTFSIRARRGWQIGNGE